MFDERFYHFYVLISNFLFLYFKVTGYLQGSSFAVTSTYVEPRNPVIQGSYVELPVMRDADLFQIEVVSTNPWWSCSYKASLTELEIFADAKNIYDR